MRIDRVNAHGGAGPMTGRFGRASLKSLALCIAATPFLSLPQAAEAETWRVTGLAPDARLHVREEADADSEVLGYVPGNARGLRSRLCAGSWCEITYGSLRGWVYKPYLARDDGPAAAAAAEPAPPSPPAADTDVMNILANARRIVVLATGDRPFPVYAFPDDRLPVAGLLPPDTREVQGLGSCMRSWCYVRSGGLIGWMNVSLFDVEATSSPEATAAIAEAAAEPQAAARVETAPTQVAPPRAATPAPADEDKALNKTETTASNIAIGGNVAALPKIITRDSGKTYSLAGLGGASALPIFDKPDANAPILAWIPGDARNIEGLRKCQDRWCLVRWENATGWVARRHLADDAAARQLLQVKGLPVWSPLKVYDQPSEDAEEVGSIPSYATGVVPIGTCNQYWCHVRYLGVAGWVTARNLQPQTP
jgi:SH3-like domain-containing protein